MNYLHSALLVAIEAHKGQLDKNQHPYIFHPLRMAGALSADGYSDEYCIVALLHDVIEDTSVTLEFLLEIFPPEYVEAVIAITQQGGEPKKDYIARVKANKIASVVKKYDCHDNLLPQRLSSLPDEVKSRLEIKYLTYLEMLNK